MLRSLSSAPIVNFLLACEISVFFVDPFVGMEVKSDAEGIDDQNDGQPDMAGNDGNGHSHIATEGSLAHRVSLDGFVVDSWCEDTCEDTDSAEHEDIDPEDESQ
jgi:hypothetical protein